MQRILQKQTIRVPAILKSLGAQSSSLSSAADSYTDRQAKLGRPVSPHVTIYRYSTELISITSTHAL